MQHLKYCLLALLWPAMNGLAQSPPQSIHALNIGDTVPEITLTNLYNYPASTIQLSRFKGKLLILDFWSTWCGSCIEAFPKMQQLQTKFKDQLQVLLVNTYMGDNIKKVKPFFTRQKDRTGKTIELPYSLQQSALAQYFPHKFVPHYVWIDQKGKIIATTAQAEITEQNIRSVIQGKQVALHVKKDMLDFDNQKPLFADGNGGDGTDFLYRSVFTPYIEGLGTSSGIEHNAKGEVTRCYMLNTSLWVLLKTAYPKQLNFPVNRIIVQAKHPALFTPGLMEDSLLYNNSFCYDLHLPASVPAELFKYMQEDIARVFRLKVFNEERLIKCLVLQKGGSLTAAVSKGGVPATDIDGASSRKFITNQPVNVLVKILNGLAATRDLPLIDETGMHENIDIVFPAGFPDLNAGSLKDFLKATGFKLLETERTIPVAVIKDH